MQLKINDLCPMQDALREDVDTMVEFVRAGSIFSQEVICSYLHRPNANLIGITRFEDGRYYLHDGHHRVAAIWLSGVRDFLYEEEFFVKELTYARYMKHNFETGWVTPFDPRTQVRVSDFGAFKDYVWDLYSRNPADAAGYILQNQHQYTLPRLKRHHHIRGLCNKFALEAT